MNDHQLEKIQFLLSQSRFELAEQEARRFIGENPDEGIGYSFLALSIQVDEQKLEEASDLAKKAVGIEPDNPSVHFVLSVIHERVKRLDESMNSIDQAIELDPYNESFFAQQSHLWMRKERWKEALDSADKGLEVSPEDEDCLNLRTMALERLGRSDEAIATAGENLKNSPNNSHAHAAMGWTLVNQGKYLRAQESCRESLRLNPNNELAREGMITSLQSSSFIYRWMHQYVVFMTRIGSKYQFAIVIGAWILIQLIAQFGEAIPILSTLRPFIMLGYFCFAIMTWITESVHNAVLRLHPMGRHLLNATQRFQSNLVITCLATAFFGLVYGTIFGGILLGIVYMMYWVMLCVPATLPFRFRSREKKWVFAVLGAIIALLPPVGICYGYLIGNLNDVLNFYIAFIWSILIYQIAGAFAASR